MFKIYYFIKSDPALVIGEHVAGALRQVCPSLDAAIFSAAIQDAIPDRPTALHGVLELWYEQQDDTAVLAQLSIDDLFESNVETVSVLAGMERTVMRKPDFYDTDGVKGIYAFRRKKTMAVDDFQHYWWHQHGPIAAQTENATCYVQCHVTKDLYHDATPAFDGVTELYWPDMPTALASIGSRQMIEDQSNDARNFVDLESVDLMMAKQHTIIPPWKESL